MRRVDPRAFVGASPADKAAFRAWMQTHDVNVNDHDSGGDFIMAIDVYIPDGRVWPDGSSFTEGLGDCWVLVHEKINPDGTRATKDPTTGRFDMSTLMSSTRTIAMKCRPPGFVLAVRDDGEHINQPGWDAVRADLVDMARRTAPPAV